MMDDAALAWALAEEAGALLLAIRDQRREEGEALGARGDREANALLLARLARARPDDAILSEEAQDDRTRCAHSRVWVIDPLDGTREYSQGRDDWAVHVALAVDGVPCVGAVALPARGEVMGSAAPPPARPLASPLRMVVSRSRPPEIARQVAALLGAQVIPMGSAGAKAMAVVDGRAEIYLHAGGQYEWDSCAPAAVALAAGLDACRIDGTPLVYNRADPLLPDLLICRPEITGAVLGALASLRPAG